MPNKSHKQSIASEATARIRSEHILPRPLGSIIAEQIGYTIVFVALFGLVVLLINILTFWLRVSGIGDFLGHGLLGIQAFALALPYQIVVITIIAITLMLVTLRHFDISYKKSYLGLVVALVFVSTGLALGVARTGLNETISGRVADGHLRPLAPLYRGTDEYSQQTRHSVVGRIESVNDDVITVAVHHGTLRIRIDNSTRLMNDRETLVPGRTIRVLGRQVENGEFTARVIIIPRSRPQSQAMPIRHLSLSQL